MSSYLSALIRHSPARSLLRKVLWPLLPGWVDEGRKIVQEPHLRAMLKKVSAHDRSKWLVLNAGAGEGLYSPLLLALSGVEWIVEADLSYGKYGHRQSLASRQNIVGASLTALPLASESADLILCSEVLEHIPDDEQAFDEIRRVLKSGGWLLISVPTPPAVYDPAHVREGYTLAELSAKLDARGMKTIEVQYCMYTLFQLLLRTYRLGRYPRILIRALAQLDRVFPFGTPMDLIILAQANR